MARNTCLPFAGLLLVTGALAAAQTPKTATTFGGGEDGSSLYRSYCSSCHGTSAKGDGPLAASLAMAPPDLTHLAFRNQGKFEPDKVARTIDGRDPLPGHGGADMPAWGDAFKRARGVYNETAVKKRVDAIVQYLEGVQVKPAK